MPIGSRKGFIRTVEVHTSREWRQWVWYHGLCFLCGEEAELCTCYSHAININQRLASQPHASTVLLPGALARRLFEYLATEGETFIFCRFEGTVEHELGRQIGPNPARLAPLAVGF